MLTGIYVLFVTVMCVLSLAMAIVVIHVHTRSIAASPSKIPTLVSSFTLSHALSERV